MLFVAMKLEKTTSVELVRNLCIYFVEYSRVTKAIDRCLPCYQLHIAAKPTLQNLTPLKAQQLLSSSSTGTLATGIFFSRQKTHLLLQGHNSTKYHQKTPVLIICA